MTLNWIAILLSSLIPMVVGFIYYNKNVVGTAWMKATGMTEEKAKSANMLKIFGFSILFNIMLATMMPSVVIHQFHIGSMLMGQPDFQNPDSESAQFMKSTLEKYGSEFRTFKHGALHGFLLSLFIGLPLIATASLYEMRGAKYNLISWGYWAISLTLMGGVICQFA
jgi:uncharacterized protein (DUF2062 family)